LSDDPDLMMKKHLVLLGGGAAHLQLLRELESSPMPELRVTLVTPVLFHVHLPLLPDWVARLCEFQDVAVPLAPWAERAQATLVESDLQAIDPEQRTLTLANGEVLHYDALSIDADAVAHRESIPGARQNALFLQPALQFVHLWEAVIRLSQMQVLSLVVVGGGAPAIELSIAIQKCLRRRARVALVTGGGPPLASEPEAVQRRVKEALKRNQVTLFEDRCDAISGRQMQLGQGMRLGCDAPLVAEAPSPPLWLFDSGMSLDANGFLVTGPTLQSLSHPAVFASGELAVRSGRVAREPGDYPLRSPLPTGLLGRNLRRFLAGGPLDRDDRRPARAARLLDVGDGRALARFGGVVVEGRWVGWIKRWVDRQVMGRFGLGIPIVLGVPQAAAKAPEEGVVPP
jgi:NADH dehydrogenase FAD-containing subunit